MRSAYTFTSTLMLVLATSALAADLAASRPLYNPADIWSRLNDANAKNELKITKQQEKGVNACFDQHRKASERDAETIFKWTGPDKEAKVRALGTQRGEELLRSLGRVLNATQVQRLKQILLQEWGITLFHHPEIRQALKLSDQQVATLKAIYDKLCNDLALELKNKRLTPQEAQSQYLTLSKGAPDQVRAALTEQQRKTLNDLLGKPYRFQ